MEFIQSEIGLIITIVGGLLIGVIMPILFQHFKTRFEATEDKILINTKRIEKLEHNFEVYKEKASTIHKDLYEIVKKVELQYSSIEAKLEMIGKTVCNGKWIDKK